MSRNTDPTRKTRAIVLDRDEHRCVVCSTSQGLQIHHRRARGMGGTRRPDTNHPQNLVTVCAHHHQWIETHRVWATGHGLLVKQSEDPAAIPVTTWRGVVLLDAAGAMTPTTRRSEEE